MLRQVRSISRNRGMVAARLSFPGQRRNAANQRLDHSLQNFAPETAAHESTGALVGSGAPRGRVSSTPYGLAAQEKKAS
jgi:hypothetical protein